MSSTARRLRVASAVAREGDLREAGLALHVLLLTQALLLALAPALLLSFLNLGLERRASLEDTHNLLEGLLLCCSALLAGFEVFSDEVATWLNLLQVVLSRDLALGLLCQILLLHLELCLLLRELDVEFRENLHEVSLFLLEIRHVVLKLVLGLLLRLVRGHLLFLRLLQDEVEHLDDGTSLLLLAFEATLCRPLRVPGRWRILLKELRVGRFRHGRVVVLQNLDRRVQDVLGSDDVFDVRLVVLPPSP